LVSHSSQYSAQYEELHLSGNLSSILLSLNFLQVNVDSSSLSRYSIPRSVTTFYFYLNYDFESRLILLGSISRSFNFNFILSSTSGVTPCILLFNNELKIKYNVLFKFVGGSQIGVVVDHVNQNYPTILNGGVYEVGGGSNAFFHIVNSESQCSLNPDYIGNRHFCFVYSSAHLGYFSSFKQITVEPYFSLTKINSPS
jgi:hypothetical protein